MSLLSAIVLFVIGLGLVIIFAERLVEGAVGTSASFGLSPFVLSVVFIGFDPENLAVGVVGSYEGAHGIALGSIIGSAMVAIALAFGITALIVPMRFEQTPRSILAVPVLVMLLFAALIWDGVLSRVDGGLLLGAFLFGVVFLFWMSRKGLDIRPTGEVAEALEKGRPSKWKSLGLFVISLAAIIVGSAMLVAGSRPIIDWLGLTETVFGMTVLALLVSIEELARELPAAWRGRPEITFGNVVGSLLAFFGFNAGIIALIRPVEVEPLVLQFYLPVCGATVVVITLLMLAKTVSRWSGAVLVLLYLVFALGGYTGGIGSVVPW